MPTIDSEGLEEVKKIKDALTHIYDKVTKKGASVGEEYSFIFKILGQMEDTWNHNIQRVYTVPDELTINGKRYTS
jgi:hypothetical protein